MAQKLILETIGTIEKKELLGPVGYDDLVLESYHPFPGYHGTTIPDTDRPKSLFIITRSKYTEERIIRATMKIKEDKKFKFDGSPGMVTLYNMLNPCIRLISMPNYDQVPDILRSYKEEGIEFMGNRKVEPFTGVIKVKKYFVLEPISNCTFNDAENPYMHYFTIPIQLRFNQFEKITLDIKRNMEEANFDAALGTIYRKNGILDVIRIYDEGCTPERLNMIRSKYTQAFRKIIK